MTSAVELTSVEEVFGLFATKGQGTYGENITQLEHALQSAALATERGLSEEMIAACLLHDLGHLVVDVQNAEDADLEQHDDRHEAIGARLLASLFGANIARPVALHVVAKRWRVATDPSYVTSLSSSSKATLIAQGGPLDPAACGRFETTIAFEDAVELRSIDDEAKVPGLEVPGLDTYRPLLEGLIQK